MYLPDGLDQLGLWIAVTMCLVAAITDLRAGKIYNWLTLPVLSVAPLAHLALGGWQAALLSGVGLSVCGLIFYVLFRFGGGGGDVKLAAATGALVGPARGLEFVFASLVAAALFSLLWAAVEGKLWGIFRNVGVLLLNPLLPRRRRRALRRERLTPIRLGPAFLAGAAAVLLRAHAAPDALPF